MKYKTYIFDFDYTLADATVGIEKSANYALGKLGLVPTSHEDIRKTVGMTLPDTLFALTGIGDKQLAEQFFTHYVAMADKVMTENTILFNDTIEVLSRLKQAGRNTAIVTTKMRYRINEALDKFGMQGLIDYVVGYGDVEKPKPAPDGLLKAIDHFGEAKQNVIYIGDSMIDANAAANAGVDFAAVTTGTTTAQVFLQLPHICIAKNLTELVGNAFMRCAD